jgi:DNA-binding transcriptional LysR family regulator
MNWDDVRIFLAVARAGQILGAARRLELNHATVSRRVAALEDALGAKLFRRLTTGSELTPSGERFLQTAERMEADMIAARSELAGGDEAISGIVRIGAPDGFGVAFLAARLGALTARHGDLRIQLVPVPRSFSLSRREADIAITTERPAEGRLVAQKLVDYSLGLYASRAYARANGLPVTQAELKDHRLVGYVPDLVFSPSLAYAQEFSPDWDAAFSISSALGQVEAVRSDAGIGILHAFIARALPDLVPVDAVKPIRRAYWLVYHESVRPLRRIQAVAGFITGVVEREKLLFL